MSEQQDATFTEAQGLESNKKAKELAKKESKRKAKKKDFLVKYSLNGEKVLKLSFKPNGVYQEYVGSINKDKSESTYLKNQITVWQKNGEFVHQHELEGFKEKFYKKEQK